MAAENKYFALTGPDMRLQKLVLGVMVIRQYQIPLVKAQ
jgi:hypothetical protein